MLTHDGTFETLAVAPVKQTDVIVVRQINDPTGYIDSTPSWTSSDALMSVTIDSLGEMLGTVTKKAKVQLLGITSGIVAGDIFKVKLGIKNVSTFDYVSQGCYIVDTVDYDYDSGYTSIVMYDEMWTASNTLYSKSVVDGAVTYPITIQNYVTYIAGLLNVTLGSGFSSLPNASYSILADQYATINGATLQNVIQDIAGATGTTARMTDTTLNFSQYSVSSENLDSNTLRTLKIGSTYGPITSVVLGRQPTNDNIAIFATSPAGTNVVTAVNTTTEVLTVVAHNMAVGNMAQFASTGTLPAPLLANTSYYVTTVTTDTFKLTPTYADAIAVTNIINLTTAGTGTITIAPLVSKEINIINNQIADDERTVLLPALYNKLAGIYWSDVKAETIGLGWHEVGDVIQFTQGAVTVRAFLSEVHLTLAGSIKETLVSIVPDVASINYQTAGGILKSIYNTEIKVDKQNNDIISVVSRQDTIEGEINDNFTSITQDVDDVIFTIQKSGGGNLLINSVGYAKEQTPDNDTVPVNYARLVSWDYPVGYKVSVNGTVTSYDSSESQNYGGISGRVIQMSSDYLTGKTVSITQRVNVAVNTPLSFGMRVRNALGKGDALVTLSNDNDVFYAIIDDTADYLWVELTSENFVTTMPWLDVTIQASAEAFRFTDLRLLYGTTLQGWVQSNAEILSANVQFTKDGMRIFDDAHDTETRVTYNEFSTRRRTDNVVLFEADDTGVKTNDLTIRGSTSYERDGNEIIKQITIPASNAKAGIAFVKGANVS